MKKLLISLISIGLSLCCIGCKNNNSPSEPSTNSSESIQDENQNNSEQTLNTSSTNTPKTFQSIKFSDTSDINFSYDWQYEIREFNIEPSENSDQIDNILEYVSENPEVATIEKSYTKNQCKIKPINPGETYVYIETKDKSVQSEKVKIIFKKKENEISKESTKTETSTNNTSIDNSRTVYTTPNGKKYHYSKECAGKNAKTTTENSAKKHYSPCKKCVE